MTAQDLCPPTSPTCINALDLASAVETYTPRTLTAHDIPHIPVYNREKNMILRFPRVASVPVYFNRGSDPEHAHSLKTRLEPCKLPAPSLLPQPDPHVRPVPVKHSPGLAFPLGSEPLRNRGPADFPSRANVSDKSAFSWPQGKSALGQSKHNHNSACSDTSSATISVGSTVLPVYRRSSTFDLPDHRRSLSAYSASTGPSNILHIDLSEEVDMKSFYECYFNKLYFEDSDSLFSSTSDGPKERATRRVASESSRPGHAKPSVRAFTEDVCLDVCADYEKSRFMVPESHLVRPHNKTLMPIVRASNKHKSLPLIPQQKSGIYERISSGTKHKLGRIFSK